MKHFALDGSATRPTATRSQAPIAATCRQLALKLRLTSLALGCSTNKELCARFATSNPATLFVPQNAYKWLSGKAMPRVSSVYQDWARVLGGALTGPFLASSSFDEFQDAVCTRFMVPETALSALRIEAGLPPDPAAGAVAPSLTRPGGRQPGERWLEGTYLAISPALSLAEKGRLIVGALSIQVDAMQRLQVSYSQNLFNRQVVMSGQLLSDGRTAQSALSCSYTHRLFFLALNVPTPPANVIGGILSGAAVHDPDARATACRILLLRSHAGGAERLAARSGHICAEGAVVENELVALGYKRDASAPALGASIVDFLHAASSFGLCETAPRDLAPLELMLDRLACA